MAKKPVVWTERAKKEKRIILQFWVDYNQNKTYASQLNIDFTKQAELIGIFNHLGKPTDFKDVRVSFIGNFSLLYKIEIEEIVIVGIWDNRRNPDDLDFNF
jgi:hypothetical protein